MAPKASVQLGDPFEVYNELVVRSRRAGMLAAALVVLSLASVATAFLSFTRPLPVVVTSDDPLQPRKVVAAGDVSVREVDARRFFLARAKELHAWSSLSVTEDLTAASLLMTTRWRRHFTSEVNAKQKVAREVDASGEASLLASYVAARVRHELELSLSDVACKKSEGVWHCQARAMLRIQPLVGDPVNDPRLGKSVVLRGSFVEVQVTERTVDGLLVDFWDVRASDAPPSIGEET